MSSQKFTELSSAPLDLTNQYTVMNCTVQLYDYSLNCPLESVIYTLIINWQPFPELSEDHLTNVYTLSPIHFILYISPYKSIDYDMYHVIHWCQLIDRYT